MYLLQQWHHDVFIQHILPALWAVSSYITKSPHRLKQHTDGIQACQLGKPKKEENYSLMPMSDDMMSDDILYIYIYIYIYKINVCVCVCVCACVCVCVCVCSSILVFKLQCMQCVFSNKCSNFSTDHVKQLPYQKQPTVKNLLLC